MKAALLVAWALVLVCAAGTVGHAEIIAFYTDATNEYQGISGSQAVAQEFDVLGTAIATEIDLPLYRSSASETGSVIVELRRANPDDYGNPSPTVTASVSVPVTKLNIGPDAAHWVSFAFSPGVSLDAPPTGANKWWIVLKQSGYPGQIGWETGSPSYGPMGDCIAAADGGFWNQALLADFNFSVYGTRTSLSTQMFVTAAADRVAPGRAVNIGVEVDDCWGNPVAGKPSVHYDAPDGGTLRATDPLLTDGKVAVSWTAPNDQTGVFTINVSLDAYSFDDNDYDASSGSTTVHVQDPDIATDGALTLTSSTISTRHCTYVTLGPIQYWDVVQGKYLNVPVGGTVSFECSVDGAGTFSSPSVTVGTDGKATTLWTASNKVGGCEITATYSGVTVGDWFYGSCSKAANVNVVYTDVPTNAPTVRVSPDYPYIGKDAWVAVEVREMSGVLVPCGTVRLTASRGSFEGSGSTADIDISGGTAVKKWTAPPITGDVTFTAVYQGATASGDCYLAGPVSSPATAHVTKDPDTSGDSNKMTWCTEYTSHYSWYLWGTTPDLPQAKTDSQAFGAAMTAMGWAANGQGSKENGNDKSWQKDFMGDSDVDMHDFTYYSGHGTNGDSITFDNLNDHDYLAPGDAYDSWGDEDAEWIALFACRPLANPDWAKCMRGLHLLCGFTSDTWSNGEFGQRFADLMFKHGPQDEPHTIVQSWFLTCDEILKDDSVKPTVMQPADDAHDCSGDYIWGQGFVQHDPDHVEGLCYDILVDSHVHNAPVVVPGGDEKNWYYGVAGEPVQFDGSGSYVPDDPSDRLTYIWDFDTDTDTDSGDYDNNDKTTTDDDCDAIGPRPRYVFPKEGYYQYRLIVRCDHWLVSDRLLGSGTVQIDKAPASPAKQTAPSSSGSPGGLEIVDRFETANLPTVTQLPVFQTGGATIGYNELASIAGTYNMSGAVGLIDTGNWSIVKGDGELTVNRDTGAVSYIDTSRAYTYTHVPSFLPDGAGCQMLANRWLNASGISHDGSTLGSFTDVCRDKRQADTRQPLSSVPFQRRLSYRRTFDVDGVQYPAVGPGGKIVMLFDDNEYDPGMFIKIWRSAQPGPVMPVRLATDVVADFHRLGPAACYGSSVPVCNRILIDNVSLGYYEEGFTTKQNAIYPVYVLDLTCQDAEGSEQTRVYLPALWPPLEVHITAPTDGASVAYGQDVSFSGTVSGGTGPYTYEWSSDVDGFLGAGPGFSRMLSGSYRDGEVTSHTISLRVTDSNGLSAERCVGVKVQPSTMSDIRNLLSGAQVWLFDPVVTATFTDPLTGKFFYVEPDDRSGGIRVRRTDNTLTAGSRANVMGVLARNADKERYIEAASVSANGSGSIRPLAMTNKSVGGGPDGLQEGIAGASGLNNIGALVRTWGRVVEVEPAVPPELPTWFEIDDGSGVNVKCVVPPGVVINPAWTYVSVTGVSSCESIVGGLGRLLRVRVQSDITPY